MESDGGGAAETPWRIRARRVAAVWVIALLAEVALQHARSRAMFWQDLFTPLQALVIVLALLGSWRALRGRAGGDRRRRRERRAGDRREHEGEHTE